MAAAAVLDSLAIPCPRRGATAVSAPRAAAVTSPLGPRGLRLLLPGSNVPRCASLPPRVKAARSRLARRGAVVCEAKGTTAQLADVSKATWQSLVLDSDVPVLVDFWAPWCGPCRMIEPTVAKLAKVYEGKLKCYKLNTDDNPQLNMGFGASQL